MSRAKYFALISWLGQSAAARRFFFVFPFILLATTARAPVVKSALIAVNSDPAAKKPLPPLDLPADGKNMPGPISLFHSGPVDQPNDSPFVLRDTADFKPISSSRDFQPVTVRPLPIAVTNDPLTPQPVTQFTPAGGNDDGLVTGVFDTSDTAVAGDIAEFGSGFGVSDPVSSNGGGGGQNGGGSGTSSAGTAVPEPVCLWLLPAGTILLRRKKSLRI
jgi:hypothetical protein